MWRPFACRPALFITFFSVDARGCRFLGSKPVDCHFISFGTSVRTTATSSACSLVWALLLRTAFCLRRFRPMAISSSACSPCLGSFAPNGFLLASIPPHGDIFIRLLALFGLFCSERLFACVDSAPWRYLPSACSQCSCSFLEPNGFARV